MLSSGSYAALVESIQAGRAEYIRRQSNTRTWWYVQHHGITMLAVYDNRRNGIVTFLPMEAINNLASTPED